MAPTLTARIALATALVTVPGFALADQGDRARLERTEYRYQARAVQHAVAMGEAERYERALPAAPETTLSTGELAFAAPARKAASLSSTEISAELAPFNADIQRCYTQRATGGDLAVTLVIGRDGGVVSLRADAPQVGGRTAARIERCIRSVVANVEFPARRNDTTAVVPYVFHKAEAPGAGPIHSCWRARGC